MERSENNPWPQCPQVFGVDYGHEEVTAVFGKDPWVYSVMTKEVLGDKDRNLRGIITQHVEILSNGQPKVIEGNEEEWLCDLCVLGMGFIQPEEYITQELDLNMDQRNHIHAVYGDFWSSVKGSLLLNPTSRLVVNIEFMMQYSAAPAVGLVG